MTSKGLISLSGSYRQNCEPKTETLDDGTAIPTDTPQSNPNVDSVQSTTDLLENMHFIRDPAFDRMAYDTSSYLTANKDLLGYMEGHRLTVMYFQQLNVDGDNRTNIMDSPNERNIINTAYLRINNFEITIPEAWTFDYDPTLGQAQITGTARLYPGLNPTVGDVFLTSQGDNKVALFRVSSVKPGSWRNQKCYEIGYYFFSYPNCTDKQILEDGAVDTVYFDKANFLGDTTSLLSEQSYLDLVTMRELRPIISRYYFRKFYNPALGTLIRPDGVYDPYLVTYMASLVEYSSVKVRPIQLVAQSQDTYDGSIWARLDDTNNLAITDIYSKVFVPTYVGKTMDVGLTPVIGRPYLIFNTNGYMGGYWSPVRGLGDAPAVVYAFSQAFYDGDTAQMTDFESFFYSALTSRKLTDTQTLINSYLNGYQTLPPQTQFYALPVMIYLIDLAIASISRQIP